MEDLKNLRGQIDEIDAEMARLFQRRFEAAKRVAAYKAAHGLPIEDRAREEAMLGRAAARVEQPELRGYYIRFLEDMLANSKRYQSALVNGVPVAYCGVEGAFASVAARRIFPEARLIGYPDFQSAYESVLSGETECCVLPIENSYAGEVGQVLDLMFGGPLYVNGVYDMPVRHSLLGLPGASPETVRTVVSHPQALEQCAAYLRAHGYRAEAASNTAAAAKAVAEGKDPSVAAIAGAEAAGLYGLKMLDHDVNASDVNTTRFAVFSRVEHAPTAADRRFLLLFTLPNEVGALAKTVNVICAHGFNMVVLRSRPIKGVSWRYYFYVEAEGDPSGEEGERMRRALAACCDSLKVAGQYAAHAPLEEGAAL